MKKIIWISTGLVGVICLVVILFFAMFPRKYNDLIDKYSQEYNLDKYLIASVINIESGYDSNSVSKAGAIGLMQILPSTAFDIADRIGIEIEENDLFNEEINIQLGSFYLRYLLDLFDGNINNTLSAYNWGLSNVKNWINDGNIDETGTITNIPVRETSNYLKKFKANKFVYKNIYLM